MQTSTVLVCLFVGIVSVPGSLSIRSKLVARQVIQSAAPLHFDNEANFDTSLPRQKRDTEQDLLDEFEWFIQPNQTWCFCGMKNWLINFLKTNLTEATKCANELEINIPQIGKGNLMSSLAEIGKASACLYNCIFEKLNLIDSEKNLKNEAVKDVFKKKVFTEEGLKDIGAGVVQRCLTTGTRNTLTAQIITGLIRGSSCGEKAYEFITCLLLEIVEDCPENKKRNDVQQCKTLYTNYAITRQFSESTRRRENLH